MTLPIFDQAGQWRSNATTLEDLAVDVAEWHAANWPDRSDLGNALAVLKVAEEAGEVTRALIRYGDGRGSMAEVIAELGDVVIATVGACDALDVGFESTVLLRWREVRTRSYEQRSYRDRTDG